MYSHSSGWSKATGKTGKERGFSKNSVGTGSTKTEKNGYRSDETDWMVLLMPAQLGERIVMQLGRGLNQMFKRRVLLFQLHDRREDRLVSQKKLWLAHLKRQGLATVGKLLPLNRRVALLP